ncbi:MAG: hypothetical protein U1F68_05255 [Gammaproteobacteria bacterium]
MANLTITIDVNDQVLQQARRRALEQGTSVNAVVREYLEGYSGVETRYRTATVRLLELAKQSQAASRGRKWTRDELYER